MLIVKLDTLAANQPSAIAGAIASARSLGKINGRKAETEVCYQQNDVNIAASCRVEMSAASREVCDAATAMEDTYLGRAAG